MKTTSRLLSRLELWWQIGGQLSSKTGFSHKFQKFNRLKFSELRKKWAQGETVHEIEPDADIILYGSRARGDAHAELDWDFLILLNGAVDDERTDVIRHRLYEIDWDCGEILSSIVRSRQEWDTPLHPITPLSQVIREQGIFI